MLVALVLLWVSVYPSASTVLLVSFTVSQNGGLVLPSIFHPVLTDFKDPFTATVSSKFTTQRSLKIPPHLKYVVTVLCGILFKIRTDRMARQQQSERAVTEYEVNF